MREIMVPLLNEAKGRYPGLFDDLWQAVNKRETATAQADNTK
jgi:hypothetical protein